MRETRILVDASYLMRHFNEQDASYRGWREKGTVVLADHRAALASPQEPQS